VTRSASPIPNFAQAAAVCPGEPRAHSGRLAEVPERSNGAVSGCFYRLPTSANGGRFGKCLIYAAASARGAKPTWELSQIPGIV
jgi:hypothetical protein